MSFTHYRNGVPKGIRTPVTAVKGQCPRPLDDGDPKLAYRITDSIISGKGEIFREKSSAIVVCHCTGQSQISRHLPIPQGFVCSLLFHQTICVSTPLELISLGKEVIQPQVPLRLPCYDFTPVMNHKVVSALPKVKLPTSFATHSHGVTGGVYKARERIHRSILIYDY